MSSCVFGTWNNKISILLLLSIFLVTKHASAEQCGKQAGGALCENNLCCSQYGWCGSTDDYCSPSKNCQSKWLSLNPSGGSSIITSSMFEDMLKHRNDAACEGKNFYTYDAFITAAKSFSAFGNWDHWMGHLSQERYCSFLWANFTRNDRRMGVTLGGIARSEKAATLDYNYRQAGNAIGVDLINNPDLVATDAVVSFKTAQGNKPSCHDVMTFRWKPSASDTSAGRKQGYGVVTNIINGGLECGIGQNSMVADRIGFYERYCGILGVTTGYNLDCYSQSHF